MKVLYDISVLGLGHRDSVCRAGIFRAVEAIALGLAASSACDLTFCASASFDLLDHSIDYLEDYLRSHPNLAQVSLAYDGWERLISRMGTQRIEQSVVQSLHQLDQAVAQTGGWQNLGLKLLRKPVFQTYLKLIQLNPLSPQSLTTADIFHANFYPFPAKLQRSRRPQCFLTIYDLIPILYPQFFQANERDVIEQGIAALDDESWVFCISHATKQDLCHYRPNLDPNRVFVTHLAASELFYPCTDLEQQASIRQKYGIPNGPYLLSLSTLEPRKNIDQTIRCFLQLVQQERIADLNLVLVGNKGWNYERILQELQAAPELRDRVILTGFVVDDDLAALYSGALAFVYPSFYEGFGLPPLEAMQCGIPVITSNTSSLPEVVGDAGLQVGPTDSDALCQALLDLYSQPDLRATLSQRSLGQAAKFSWQTCVEATLAAYRTALQTAGKAVSA